MHVVENGLLLRLALLALPLAPALAGCGDDEGEGAEQVEPEIEVAPLEIAVSHRTDGQPPEGAFRIEMAPRGIEAGGHRVLDLEAGRMPESEWQGGQMVQLAGALDAHQGPKAAVLRLHATIPYVTVARAIATLLEHDIHELYFEVREGMTPDPGYLPVKVLATRPPSYDPVEFSGPGQREWDEFVEVWEEVVGACRRSDSVDCFAPPERVAVGGKLEIELFTRQRAMRVYFRRFGVPGESWEEPPPLIPPQNTREAPPPGQENQEPAEPPPEPPAKSAVMMWRKRAATAEESPISLAMRPLCGADPCAVRLAGDELTNIAQVLSLIGAAFPNGAPVPVVLWEMPRR